MTAVQLIQKHEGLRLTPYRDSRGKLTIGYGRNLEDRGITAMEALMLLQADFTEVYNHALGWSWFRLLNLPRQAVILDMAFNLGVGGFLKFERLIDALQRGDYAAAAAEMLNSAWAHEVGDRALEDAQIMDTGAWPAGGES